MEQWGIPPSDLQENVLNIRQTDARFCTYACSREQDEAGGSGEEGGTHCSRVKRA